jgi:hypothetical protein
MRNIYQIWVSGTPGPEIIDYMESVIDAMDTVDTYTLIADNHFLSHKAGVLFVEVSDIISDIKFQHPGVSDIWDNLSYEHKSDLIRYQIAAAVKNVFYIDCDCSVLSFPKAVSAFPHFAKCTNSGTTVRDHYFYNNSNLEFFKKLIDSLVEYMVSPKFNGYYCGPFKILNKQLIAQKQLFSVFDDSGIVHHN